MKALNLDEMRKFVLSNEEMINVRGGKAENPTPPIVIVVTT
jgi:hypothetical protein